MPRLGGGLRPTLSRNDRGPPSCSCSHDADTDKRNDDREKDADQHCSLVGSDAPWTGQWSGTHPDERLFDARRPPVGIFPWCEGRDPQSCYTNDESHSHAPPHSCRKDTSPSTRANTQDGESGEHETRRSRQHSLSNRHWRPYQTIVFPCAVAFAMDCWSGIAPRFGVFCEINGPPGRPMSAKTTTITWSISPSGVLFGSQSV